MTESTTDAARNLAENGWVHVLKNTENAENGPKHKS